MTKKGDKAQITKIRNERDTYYQLYRNKNNYKRWYYEQSYNKFSNLNEVDEFLEKYKDSRRNRKSEHIYNKERD